MLPRHTFLNQAYGRLPAGLPLLRLDLKVLAREIYDDRDTPSKLRFRRPWRSWRGVDVHYLLNGRRIVGSRGKTVWYVPLSRPDIALPLGLRAGMALKIVKIPVHTCPREEALRLSREVIIQRKLARHGMAPGIDGLIAVQNSAANTIRWFSQLLHYPAGSIHLATVVEHVMPEPLSTEVSCDGPDFLLEGPPVIELKERCRTLGIEPYDLCLGNVFQVYGALQAVDIHKWTMKPAPDPASRSRENEEMPWSTRAAISRTWASRRS